MARPLNEDKRRAILDSAVRIIASQGLGATTALIAKEAGISTGSLFTYFPDKVTLFNQLYLHIKTDVADALLQAFPLQADIKEKAFHVWQSYTVWACNQPERRAALQQLSASRIITEDTRQQSMSMFDAVNQVLSELGKSDLCQNVGFITAIMASLAETTVDFAVKEPEKAEEYTLNGFRAFWRTLGM
ncbi:HTH-type transcriptional repressor Bm3R1 [Yersinia frederiksenii]|uniref:TetR/AcrR family transcriptional regulator n=2 Tax=Yersinia alsatica TaxID=2890317 RepID=A0ABY5UJF7_9GAMM|nr:TetR/AcrR family transcriptional regulator [Yersinia alsatica]OVZ91138.1 TetR family transcriptional regulator [Yersinia frederiksenii]OWF67112.1 TetR family transcriptional regulator [Yersinia frederiksenii]OWF76176.1 TetR family transcriptional regulator [Yersinia frederiksenii]UWM43601.1 TetR/AcrR family transcriptional regulator [Yersinia alsatica]CFQ62713.1 HTH-type transcriptional repressor Bm3R1 [Yersinia frederiksenii]